MTMTKMHKEIAMFLVQLTEREGLTERDVMQEITRKTKELMETLRLGISLFTLTFNEAFCYRYSVRKLHKYG